MDRKIFPCPGRTTDCLLPEAAPLAFTKTFYQGDTAHLTQQRYAIMIKANLFLVRFVCLANNVAADCMTDRFGEVYYGWGKCVKDKEGKVFCSKYQFGDAIINIYGKAVCGTGRCLTGSDFNNYVCNSRRWRRRNE